MHIGKVIDKINGYEVLDCNNCGFVHINPIPTQEELDKVYKEEYYTIEKPKFIERQLEDIEWWNIVYDDRYDFFEQNLPDDRRKILDIGCGPGFFLLNKISEMGKEINVVQNPFNMAQIMSEADLAIASFGVTAYELAAMGVPAIYLCLTEDHKESASAFVKSGIANSLGVFTQMTEQMIAENVKQSLNDPSGRARMSERAKQLVDGRGIERITHMVITKLRGNQSII